MNKGAGVVLLPDGVGVRNFLLGSFAGRWSKERRLCVMHGLAPSTLPEYQAGFDENIRWEPLTSFRESPGDLMARFALYDAQMLWAGTRSMRFNLTRKLPGSWKQRVIRRAARLWARLHASPSGILVLDRRYSRRIARKAETAACRRLLREMDARILFCSHQRPHNIVPATLAARELGVPSAVFIFSWDNLSSKGRMPVRFDHYLVWSALMRDELRHYYPDVRPEQIHIVGTPQFDPYADDSLAQPREQFFAKVGADPSRPLICFSGGDLMTCPDDTGHLTALLRLIREDRIHGRPQVLARPSPADDGARYDELRRQFPELLYVPPLWRRPAERGWAGLTPSREDVAMLANLVRHADLNVNMASTMTLDFAVHDKPVVNLAFDASEPPVFGAPIWEIYYRYEHYRHVVKSGAARFARSPEELAEHVNAYLADPSLDRANRRALLDLEVGWPIGQSTSKTIEVLESLAK